jgi:hypothetical protein
MRELRARLAVVAASWVAASMLAPGCMLITSPGSFTIVDASVPSPKPEAGNACASLTGSKCADCIAATCCTAYTSCENSTACTTLLSCDPGDTSCTDDNASGMSLLDAYTTCTSKKCSICLEAGIGDPCTDVCAKGTCNGLFCSEACTSDSDCSGLGQDGENTTGTQNRCVVDAAETNICFPGCNTATDCDPYAGTTCVPAFASNGGTTNVCSISGDAGVPDAGFDAGDDGGEDASDDVSTEPEASIGEPDATTDATSDGSSDAF